MSTVTPDEFARTTELRARALASWVEEWNRLCALQAAGRSPPSAGAPLSDELRDHLDDLYSLIGDDLLRAANWRRHLWLGHEPGERALNLFTELSLDLIRHRRQLSLDHNTGLLVTIADKRAIDTYHQEQRWAGRNVSLFEDGYHEAVAPNAHEAVEALLDDTHIIRAARDHWATLPWPDAEIMQLRFETSLDYPRTFASIAARLGSGYTEDTVSKRYRRVLERTRNILREQGLLDGKGED